MLQYPYCKDVEALPWDPHGGEERKFRGKELIM
jgi:hypothetical protein